MPDKVKAILNVKAPTACKEVRLFMGLVNYYRDSWIRRSDALAPLTALTSEDAPFKWTAMHEDAFNAIKRIVAREVLLAYPIFGKEDTLFEIHTDASAYQLGAVMTQ